MDQTAYHTRAPEDLIVALALAATWFVYALGGLYVLGPVLGVGLAGLLFARAYLSGFRPESSLRFQVAYGSGSPVCL